MEGKSLRDLDAAISNMSRSLQAFYAGDPYAHRPVAVELRKLLCENRRGADESLMLRDNPKFSLHPLAPTLLPIDGPNVYVFRGQLVPLFDERAELLTLAAWREQQLVSQDITIRDLIKSVADKEGAHSDREPNETLKLLQSFRIGDTPLTPEADLIASIGHYVLRNLLVRRLVLKRGDHTTHYLAQRKSLGPGALRMTMAASPRPYSADIALGYVTAKEACELRGDPSADFMRSHTSTTSFLLWVDDLQGGFSLSQIGRGTGNIAAAVR